MLVPAGITAKLIRIADPYSEDFRATEVCDKLKINTASPVIVLAGAMTDRAGKTLAGIARAAFRTDAVIIDSGLGSGIEKFSLRKKVPLIGVAPEHEVIYPRINPVEKKDNELTNGHTHFFLIGDRGQAETANRKARPEKKWAWGDETELKYGLAQRISLGRKTRNASKQCKIITVLVGDNPECHRDVIKSIHLGIPIIALEGSDLCNYVCSDGKNVKAGKQTPIMEEVLGNLRRIKFIKCPNSSEDLASMVHLMLTIDFN